MSSPLFCLDKRLLNPDAIPKRIETDGKRERGKNPGYLFASGHVEKVARGSDQCV